MTPLSSISRYRSFPSRVRSPTPQNTDLPPWPLATLLISSMITTVLPTPAPPNRPILPPFTNGAIRSMTLMPVSKISVLGSRSVNLGVSRWIGHRERARREWRAAVHRLAEHVEDPAERDVAHRHRDGRAGVGHLHAAGHAVGGAHGHRAHLVLADVLLHLGGEADGHGARRVLEGEGVVDLGQVLRLELDVEHRADDLDDAADVLLGLRRGAGLLGCDGGCHS